MSKLENIETELVDLNDSKIISTKLAAVNNNVRFSILEILRDFQVTFDEKNTNFKKDPLYYREINSYLADNYNINITPQMLGQHLKQLLKADLIEEVNVKKEIPNKVGLRTVKAYKLKEDAFEDLFLDINFLSDELLYFFDLYCVNQKFKDDECCVLTIFNGVDKGKSFKVNNDETVLIGRKDNFENSDFSSLVVLLDNDYVSVSSISKPHLKIFYEDDFWYVLDEASTNGTFVSGKKIPQGIATKLKNNSFLKLSRGNGGVVIYCSF